MKIAIYSQKKDLDTFLYLSRFISELTQRKITPILHRQLFLDLEFSENFETFSTKEEIAALGIDYFFSFGGDGTILNALIFIQELNIPIVGVNTGRLGFLASFSKDEIFNHLDDVLQGKLGVSERSVMKVNCQSNCIDFPYALNDVNISRKETTSMITIESFINHEFLTVFWGDGIVLSTPTGSTAYSLACGGPIISPSNENFCITPIAPHNLNVRPLVLKDDVHIRLKVQSRAPKYILSLDSRLYDMNVNDELIIEKANFKISLIQPNHLSFFETIRQKLLWGNDSRN